MTSCEDWFFLVSWNWLSLAQTACWNWLLCITMVVPGCEGWFLLSWNWLWLAQTGSSWLLQLAVTCSNWFFPGSHSLLKLAQTGFSLSLKLAVTSSNWFSLGVVHNRHYIYVESGLSATSKELPSAFKILHGRPDWQMWNRSSYKGKRRQLSIATNVML